MFKVVVSPELRRIAPHLTVNCQANFRLGSLVKQAQRQATQRQEESHQLKQLLAAFNGAQHSYRSVQLVTNKEMADCDMEHRYIIGAKLLLKGQTVIDVTAQR
ncbi:unnamed protein product [Caenorhabditis nigoni]